jgi:hypothetical protein
MEIVAKKNKDAQLVKREPDKNHYNKITKE